MTKIGYFRPASAKARNNMKHALLAGFLFLASTFAVAQKYAIVDTKYILQNMPDYHAAQKELDQTSMQWQTEIEKRHETIDKLKKALAAERVLLTDQMITDREEEIQKKELEARELQRKRFGIEGDLFKRRQELIQPIQDMIYEAIAEVADRSGYMVVFDKGTHSNILYVNTKYDLSDRILRRMGIRPGEATGGGDEDEKDDNDKGRDGGSRGNMDGARDGGRSPGSRTEPAKGGSSGSSTPRRRP